MPIPLRKAGNYILYPTGTDSWISGIAFGKNLWGHAKNSAKAYMSAVNGGTPLDDGFDWNSDWNAGIPFGKITTLKVPVVPNGKDKILYI